MTPKDELMNAAKALGEMEHIVNMQIFNYAMTASAFRNLQRSGHKSEGLAALGGNEIKVAALMKMLDELERRLHGGAELEAALRAVVRAGWLNRIELLNEMEIDQS